MNQGTSTCDSLPWSIKYEPFYILRLMSALVLMRTQRSGLLLITMNVNDTLNRLFWGFPWNRLHWGQGTGHCPLSPMKYNKEYSSPSELISILQSRGLDCSDIDNAIDILSSIGYYRLSGYFYPFLLTPKSEHIFLFQKIMWKVWK